MAGEINVVDIATRAIAINEAVAKVASRNIAGANQPGYTKIGFDFQGALQDLSVYASRAIPVISIQDYAATHENYISRVDGKINLDEEVANMSEAAGRIKVISKIITAKMSLTTLAVMGKR